ncbi:MAG: T9SS type A sorting domain-containing protein [Candidatus Krumholzibacteria bacterium]|nr:T9SS type A sorting domain-containing protein [Candidatus Krumholzibacteria bacterium]
MKTFLIPDIIRVSRRALLALFCITLTSGVCLSQPRLGIYFDGHRHCRPVGQFTVFEAQLYLTGTAMYVSGIEYSIETPNDPNHLELMIMGVEYPDNFSVMLGDPFSGHSITFYPPVAGYMENPVICTIQFLALQGCDVGLGYEWPMVISPHPDSGYLRGTSWPGHELFDLTGETSYLCPCHWPPELDSVQVYSQRSVRAWFNQCVYDWQRTYDDQFLLYMTYEPHDTIDIVHAVKHSPLDADVVDFFVYLESPMQNGEEYTLEANACCECNGCATSTRRFVYFDRYSHTADLAVTFWIDYDNGLNLDAMVPHGCSEFEVDYAVRNLGSRSSQPFLSRITATPREGGEPVTVWSDSCGGLTVDGTFEGSASIAIPWMPAHRCYLSFEADHSDLIEEVNEENNISRATLWTYRPEIISIEDVPDDDGGQVDLAFRASMYEVDRHLDGDYYRILRLNSISDEWEDVLHHEATSNTVYSCVVPTAVDSSDTSGSYHSVFMVDYSTYTSCPDSGYSVNNWSTAVLLLTSSAETTGESVVLRWSVAENQELEGFIVSRARQDGRHHVLATIPASPGEVSFEFEDTSVEHNVDYTFRVEYIDGDGVHTLFETEPLGLPPLPFALHQNRPNPFNPSTEIIFSLPRPSEVILYIYDISGKRVRRLLEERRQAGRHSARWNGLDDRGSPVVSGVYFYRLKAGKESESRKMILLR